MSSTGLSALAPEVRRAIACMIDPVVFSREAGIEPDPWQAKLLRSNAKRILLNCSRQSGKSTTKATKAYHKALYCPGSLTLVISPTQRQSGLLFHKVLELHHALGEQEAADAESALQLRLRNGSWVVALPGKEGTVRGYGGVDLLIIDEAAKVSDELYYTVRPMLAVSGGELLAGSSPFGTRGWWYEAWIGSEGWERYEVPAEQCPRITPEFLAEERRTMGDWWFSQEYGCQFLDAQTAAFREADIRAAFAEEIDTWEL